jgi:hypothetical protein
MPSRGFESRVIAGISGFTKVDAMAFAPELA